MPANIVVIGLHGCEPDLVESWARAGALPVLGRLLETGAVARFDGLYGLGHEPAWHAISSGNGTGHIGRYYFDQVPPGQYRPVNAEELEFPYDGYVWDRLSRHGRRIALFDLERPKLLPEFNGIQLIEYLVHDASRPVPRSDPPDLVRELERRFGHDPLRKLHYVQNPMTAAEAERWRDLMAERAATKGDASLAVLQEGDWDVFFTNLHECHDVGHMMWHFHDPSHRWYREDDAQRVGDPLETVYRAVDGAVGRILEGAGDDTIVMVVTALGMGPNRTGSHLIAEVLRRLDVGSGAPAHPVSRLRRHFRSLVPDRIRDAVKSGGGAVYDRMLVAERSRRRFFDVPNNDNAAAVRVNLAGRERNGVVPSEQYDAVCEEITNGLMELVDCETGEPAVEAVVKVADAYPGPMSDHLPDLLAVWNTKRPSPYEAVRSPKIGEVRLRFPYNRSGDHTYHCMLMMTGRGIRPGPIAAPVSICDIAPTVASFLGHDLTGVAGTPIRMPAEVV